MRSPFFRLLPALVALVLLPVAAFGQSELQARITASPESPAVGQPVLFTITVSARDGEPWGGVLRFQTGDGSSSNHRFGASGSPQSVTYSFDVSYQYGAPGAYTVELYHVRPSQASDDLVASLALTVTGESVVTAFAAVLTAGTCPGFDEDGNLRGTTVRPGRAELGMSFSFFVCTNTSIPRQLTVDLDAGGEGQPPVDPDSPAPFPVSVDPLSPDEAVSHVYTVLGIYWIVLSDDGVELDRLRVTVSMNPAFDPDGIRIDLAVPDPVDHVVIEQSEHRPLVLTVERPDRSAQLDVIPALCYLVRLTSQNANVPGSLVGPGGADAFFRSPAAPTDAAAGAATYRLNFPAHSLAPRTNRELFIAADAIIEPDEVFILDVFRIGPVPVGHDNTACTTLPDTDVRGPALVQHRILIRDPGFGVPLTLTFLPDPAHERSFLAPVQMTAFRELDSDVLPPDACYRVTLRSYTATAPGGGGANPDDEPDISFMGEGAGEGGATFDLNFIDGLTRLRYPNRLFVLPDDLVEGEEIVHVVVRACDDTTDDPILADRYQLVILDDDTPFALTFRLEEPAQGNRVVESNQDQVLQFVLTRQPTAGGAAAPDLAYPQRCYRLELDLFSAATVPGVTEIDRYPVDVAFQPPGFVRNPVSTNVQQPTGSAIFEVTFLVNEQELLIDSLFLFGDRKPEVEEWFRLRFYEGAETCAFPAGLRFPTLTEIVYIDDDDTAQETVPPLVVAFSRVVAVSIAGAIADRADCSLTGRCSSGIVPRGIVPPWLIGGGARQRFDGLLQTLTRQAGGGYGVPPPSGDDRPPGWVGDMRGILPQMHDGVPYAALVGQGQGGYSPSPASLLGSMVGLGGLHGGHKFMWQPRQLPGGAPIAGGERYWTFWAALERRSASIVQNATNLAVGPSLTMITGGVDRAIGRVVLGGFYTLATGEGRAILSNEQYERVWGSHQFGPYFILPLHDRVTLWAGGYLQRARMDQRTYPDPDRVLGIPADLRGTVVLGGVKFVLFRAGQFDVGFTADVFQGQVGRAYPEITTGEEGDLPPDQQDRVQQQPGQQGQDALIPQRRPLESLPYARQRLAAVVGYQVVRGRFTDLRLAVELAGRRDTGIDRPTVGWPLPVDPTLAPVIMGGDIGLRLSYSDSLRHISLSSAYLVQVFQQPGYTAAARAFSASLRFGRVGPDSGPWLSLEPMNGIAGLQGQSWWDETLPTMHHGDAREWTLPVRAGWQFSEHNDLSLTVTPPVRYRRPEGFGSSSPHLAAAAAARWGEPRWSFGVMARLGL